MLKSKLSQFVGYIDLQMAFLYSRMSITTEVLKMYVIINITKR